VVTLDWRYCSWGMRTFSQIWIWIRQWAFLSFFQIWRGASATLCTLANELLTVGALLAFLATCAAGRFVGFHQLLWFIALSRLAQARHSWLLRVWSKCPLNALFGWRSATQSFLGWRFSRLKLTNMLSYSKVDGLAEWSQSSCGVLLRHVVLVIIRKTTLI
jgi:hypothetical protein